LSVGKLAVEDLSIQKLTVDGIELRPTDALTEEPGEIDS
jgi:hypothetical protein